MFGIIIASKKSGKGNGPRFEAEEWRSDEAKSEKRKAKSEKR